MIRDLIVKNRTYRRYHEEEKIGIEELRELIDNARLSSCGNNMQPLKYIISLKKDTNSLIFSHLKWAAALPEWEGPEKGERPVAYIVMLLDTAIRKTTLWDHGIAATNILLSATEKGYGGCMFASFDKEKLKQLFHLPDSLEPIMVISLGVPKEEVVLEDMIEDQYRYYRDKEGVHHVPKRSLDKVIYAELF